MNYGVILKTLGALLASESIAMLPAMLLAVFYGEKATGAFGLSIALVGITGIFLYHITPRRPNIGYREGFAIVAFGWLFISAFGALPFYLTGATSTYLDAFFESASGFTTTGASVIPDVEILPQSVLFWRALTHWLGGMGILVLTLAFLQTFRAGTMQMYKAESPGPVPGKLVPKMKETAQLLYGVYLVITLAEIILLKAAGLGWFDAVTHTFATVGTGGFSTKNASIGHFDSPLVEYIVTIFMLISAGNFAYYYYLFHGKWRALVQDEEFRFYGAVVGVSTVLIAVNLIGTHFQIWEEAFRAAFFQVGTIISTTGFATEDFDRWPDFSRSILFILMFLGGCSGSTGGGIKNIRMLLLIKVAGREFLKLLHPRAVIAIKYNGKAVPADVLANISGFFFLYISLFVASTMIVIAGGLDLISATSAVAATLGNVGPGFGAVGPMTNYAELPNFIKGWLAFLMIAGRLELYTILVVLLPKFYQD